MSYQVIARKWRPQSFSELKGQSSTRKTLMNAVASGRLHHALLFAGPRGTGKTSTARILAKILRCTDLQADYKPCNQCKDCQEISAGRSLDVLEIDGASNNGVDSIRELRDQVNFNPASGSVKIYIIDEVHMLSTSAFNALLKTLEEPPDGVYFIMATTEVHKLPKTILSRCQKYDFKAVPLNEVISLLEKICQSEGVEYEQEALFLIAQSGEGCVRDSLSLLDQSLAFSNEGALTKDRVLDNLGILDISAYAQLLSLLLEKQTQALVKEVQAVKKYNVEPQIYLEELVQHIKNLILFKVDGEFLSSGQDFSESQVRIYNELAQRAQLEDLYILFDICFKGTVDLARSFNPQTTLEVTLLKAGTAPLYQELFSGEVSHSGASHAPRPVPASTASASKSREVSAVTPKPQDTKSPAAGAPTNMGPSSPETQRVEQKSFADSPAPSKSFEPSAQRATNWKIFVNKLKALNPVVGSKLELCDYKYLAEEKTIYISAGSKNAFMASDLRSPEFLQKVQNYLKSIWGSEIKIAYATEERKSEPLKDSLSDQKKKDKTERLAKITEAVENHEVIKDLKTRFKAEITEISEPK